MLRIKMTDFETKLNIALQYAQHWSNQNQIESYA